jgi:hypothetical protein
MDCHQVAKQGIVVLYVNGKLKPVVQTEYEIHILECQKCFEDLEKVQALQAALIPYTGLDGAGLIREKSTGR